jgi:hypothetical protein
MATFSIVFQIIMHDNWVTVNSRKTARSMFGRIQGIPIAPDNSPVKQTMVRCLEYHRSAYTGTYKLSLLLPY